MTLNSCSMISIWWLVNEVRDLRCLAAKGEVDEEEVDDEDDADDDDAEQDEEEDDEDDDRDEAKGEQAGWPTMAPGKASVAAELQATWMCWLAGGWAGWLLGRCWCAWCWRSSEAGWPSAWCWSGGGCDRGWCCCWCCWCCQRISGLASGRC